MKTSLFLLLLIIFQLMVHAEEKKQNSQRLNRDSIIYIDVSVDQPNVDDCYDETKVPDAGVEKWLNVYPNPNQGVFYLDIQRLSYGENIEISVLNTTGENVYKANIQADGGHYQMKLNLAYLPKGVYLIHVRATMGINVQRLIIL